MALAMLANAANDFEDMVDAIVVVRVQFAALQAFKNLFDAVASDVDG